MIGSRSDERLNGAPPDAAAAPRVALALGTCGALGEALLAALVAAPRYGWVHVGHRHSAGAGASKFRPWVIGSTLIVAEDAYLVLSEETHLPSPSPVRRFAPKDALQAAMIARDAGARRIALIEPLPGSIGAADAAAIDGLEFDTVVFVQAGAPPVAEGRLRRLASLGRRRRAVTAQALAGAIISELTSASPGRHRLGIDQLHALADRHAL